MTTPASKFPALKIWLLLALAGCAAGWPASLAAQTDAIRENNTSGLSQGTAWSTGTPLTDANIGVWNNIIDGTVPGANTTSVGDGFTVGGLRIENPAVAITIAANTGSLILGNSSVVTAIDLSAATVDLTIAANTVLAASQTWSIGTGRTLTISGILSGNAGVTKAGDGALTLSGANAYNGTLALNAGTLNIGTATTFQNAVLNLNGGTVSFGTLTTVTLGGLAGTSNLALVNAATPTPAAVALNVGANGQSTSYTGVLSGIGSLIKNDNGELSLGGANTYTGATTVNRGTLAADFSLAGAPAGNIFSATSALTLNGGDLRFTGAAAATNTQTLSGLTLGAGMAANVGVNLNGAAGLTVNLGNITRGAGVVLNFGVPDPGANITTGTTGTNGVLTGAAGVAFATINNNQWAGVTGGNIVSLSYVTSPDSSSWTAADNVNLSTNPSAPVGNVTINSLILSDDSDFVIDAGSTFTLGTGGLLMTGDGVNTVSGGTLRGSGGTGKELVVIQNNMANPLVVSSIIADNGGATGLTKAGNGVLTLVGANTYTGATTVLRGTLALGASDVLPSAGAMNVTGGTLNLAGFNDTIGALTVTNGGTVAGAGVLTVSSLTVGNGTISANLSSTGGLSMTTPGTMSISSTSTFSGTLTLTNGAIELLPGANLSTAGGGIGTANNTASVAGNRWGMLVINGGNLTSSGGFTVQSSAPNNSMTSGILLLDGNLTLNAGLTITNSNGQNTQRPWVVVSGGNLVASSITANRISGSTDTVISGGLIVNGGNVTVTGSYLQATNSWAFLTVNGGNFTAANVTLSQTNNSRGGYLLMSSGNFTVTDPTNGLIFLNALNQTNSTISFSGGTGDVEKLTLASAVVTTVGTNVNANFTGGAFYIGSGGIVNNGTVGVNMTVNGGLIGAKADWSSAANVPIALGANNATFQSANLGGTAFNITLGGNLSGAGGLIKTGNGMLTLTGTNSYAGTTNVAAGTLQIGNGGSTGSLGAGDVTNSGTLIFNRGNALTLSTAVSGGGSVIKQGNGILNITSSNTYTGGTTVSAGTLLVNNTTGSATGTGAVSFASGASLGGNGTIGGAVTSATGAIIQPGNSVGTLTVGSLTVASGVIFNYEFNTSPANDLIVVTAGDGLVFNGGGFNFFSDGTENQWLVTGTYNLFQFSGNAPANLSALSVLNPVSFLNYSFQNSAPADGFVQVLITSSFEPNTWISTTGGSWGTAGNWNAGVPPDNAIVTFANVLNANGTVTLDGDRVAAGAIIASTLSYTIAQGGGGNLTFSNGASAANITINFGNHTISAPMTFGPAGLLIDIEPASSLAISGSILATSGALTKTGNGNLSLTGANAYSGGTILEGGRTTFAALTNLGTGDISFNGGALVWGVGNSADISSRTVAIAAGGAFLDTNGNDVTLASPIGGSGAGALTKLGAGALTLDGANTYTGGTVIQAGTIEFSTLDNFGPSGAITFNGGALRWAAGASTDMSSRATFFDAGGATFNTNGNNVSLASSVGGGGTGGFTKAGNGVLTLGAAANYTGATAINAGTLALGLNNALPAVSNVTVGSGATLDVGIYSQTVAGLGGSGMITLGNGGNLTLNAAADTNVSNAITGTGAFTKDGLGNATLLVSSTFSGVLGLNSGELIVPDGVSLTSGTAVTARNTTAMLVINGGTFTANGLVTVNSVADINTISGGILISGGEANFNSGLSLNNTAGQNSERPWVVVTGGNLNATNITNARTSGSSSATTGGLIVSGGNVVVQNTYLQANVSWGAMTVNGGNFTAGTYIASQTATAGRGGILQVTSGNFSVTNSANGGFIVANASSNNVNVTFSGGVSSLAALTFAPNATINAGTANVNLTGGLLYIGSGGVVNNGSGTFAANFNASGGVLGATADWSGSVPIALSGTGVTLQAANSQGDAFTYTLAGALTGTSGITKTGAGTVVLAVDNTYTGATTISEGTLQIGNGGSAGSLGGNTTVTNNGVLAFARGDNALSVDAVISGTGGLHQIGPGTTSLTAQNTYTGATTISGGTLNINNAAGVGVTGNVGVSSGGALGGTGTVSGVVTVAAGGAVAPGSGGIGTLTVGSLNLADNSFLNLEFSDTPSNDLIVVTTADGLTLGNATVNLYQAGTTSPWNVASTYTFLNFNSTLAPNVSTLEVGNPLYGLAYSFNSTTTFANLTITEVPLTFRWVAPGNGDWGTAANWSENTVPDAAGELVNLLATNTAPTSITLDGSRTIGGVVFASNNPYSIVAGAGALTFDNSGSAGNVSVFLGNNTIDAPVVLGTTHGVVANIGSGARLNISGNISESASAPLTKTGVGTLALSGNNSHTGATSLVAGTLALNSPEALGTGPFIIAGGTLANDSGAEIVLTTNNAQQWNADFSFIGPDNLSLGTGAVTLSANRTVTIASGANLGVFGAIGGSGISLTKAGNGTLVLGGMSTYDGGTFVTAGTLSFATNDALATTAPVTVSGGVLDLQFFSLGVSTLHLTGGNVIGTGVITATSDYDLQSGTITEATLSGSVGLVKSGAGAITLAGAANYTGATTVQNGTLVLGAGSNRLPDGAVVTLGGAGNTASLQLGDSMGSTSQTLSGLVSAGGNVNVVGGNTFASQLTLNISSGDATFSGVLGNGVNNTTVVGNALSLIKDGDGVLELSGNNTFAGGVTINAGTLRVSSGGNLGNVAGTLQILESTLHATASFNTNRAVSINGLNSTILVDSGVTLTFGTGTFSGFGNLNKTGAGELVLTSTNSGGFIGDTIIHAGTITLASSPALQGSTLFYDNQGGAINFGNLTAATLGGLKGAQNLPLPADFTLVVGNDLSVSTYSGALSGSGASFVKVGFAALHLTGVNMFTGDVAVANGALLFSTLDNLGAGTGITLNGGSLRWDTGSTVDVSTRTITLSGGDGGFDTNGNDIAFANGVGNGGSGILQKNGDGTLTLNGVNDYLGATSVRFGTLVIGAAGSIPSNTAVEVEFGARFDSTLNQDLTVGSLSGSGEVAVANGGNVTVGGNNISTTFTGTLNAGASTNFIKTGTGRLELSAVLNYGGATTISGGTLAVNGALPVGSPVTVNPGGTLAGSGTVGNVTVAAGGVLAPGNSIGTQTVGNLTWSSNNTLSAQWELSDFDNSADLISIAGTLTKGTGSVFLFDFQGTGYFSGSEPTTYTLMDFSANSGFTVGDFAYQNLASGISGSFLLNANNLQFIVVPEPSTWALLAGATALGLAAARRRRR